jgi:hypothetical protein
MSISPARCASEDVAGFDPYLKGLPAPASTPASSMPLSLSLSLSRLNIDKNNARARRLIFDILRMAMRKQHDKVVRPLRLSEAQELSVSPSEITERAMLVLGVVSRLFYP